MADRESEGPPAGRTNRWKRPILPLAILQGYAGFYMDRECRRIRIWREIDDDEFDAALDLPPNDFRRGVTVFPTAVHLCRSQRQWVI